LQRIVFSVQVVRSEGGQLPMEPASA